MPASRLKEVTSSQAGWRATALGHRVRRARCRLRARRTCSSYPLACSCAVVWCCVLAGPRLSARAMLPSACLAHGGETEVETARARLSGVVPRTVSTLVSIHRHHSKRRQPKGHDLGLSRLASSARRALELKARVASEPPAPASRHGSFRDRLYNEHKKGASGRDRRFV